jgi:Ser/Thr protein kinase RdoA (MazF antagonist)
MVEDRQPGHAVTIPSGHEPSADRTWRLAGMNRRPMLRIVAPGASPEEAAAVVAALERFMRETASRPALPAPARNRWQQTALYEGVARAPETPLPWT